MSTSEHIVDQRVEVSRSCRVLEYFGQGHFCFGHVSSRAEPGGPVFVKAASVGLGRVTTADVAAVNIDGENLSPGLRLHDETVLHLEVYRARAEVGAVVHTHPLRVEAMAMLDFTSDVYSQDGVVFDDCLAWYESAALVSTPLLGRAFAECLGSARAALLRSHGLVTVGVDVAEATVLALLLERGITAWMLAASVGTPRPIGVDLPALSDSFESAYRSRVESIWRDSLRAAGVE